MIGGDDATINLKVIKSQLKVPYLIRFAGDIDEIYCNNKIEFFPKEVKKGHMGILPSEIGFNAIIKLQAGGLKVGELLSKKELKNQNICEIINWNKRKWSKIIVI